ncbi:MAG: cytochrome P450 [Verrucomicrobiota bacterium]
MQTSTGFNRPLVKAPPFYGQWRLAGNPALFFDALAREFGDFVYCRGLFNFYLINHPALVKQVLKETHTHFDKHSIVYNRFRNAFGSGLVTAEGERWKRQRKLMQPLFNPVSVRHYFGLMKDSAEAMADRWEAHCRAARVFNVADDMSHITLEIAGRALFSDGFDRVSDDVLRWSIIINHYSAVPPVPVITNIHFPSLTNLKLKWALRQFDGFFHEMIERRRSGTEREDLLSHLLNARHEETGEPMSERELKEELLGMIIGGHETSSSALSWIWYELHRHPEVAARVVEELHAVTGDGELTLDQLSDLKWTRMVIEETMRLHPPFWFENRNVMQEVELGGARIPQGAIVVFSRYSLHRHPDFWQEPERFRPERFERSKEENPRSSCAYIPFGGGSRICIGNHFAMMELIVTVAVVLRRYKVIVDGSDRHRMTAHLTMVPRHGVRIRLEERS